MTVVTLIQCITRITKFLSLSSCFKNWKKITSATYFTNSPKIFILSLFCVCLIQLSKLEMNSGYYTFDQFIRHLSNF